MGNYPWYAIVAQVLIAIGLGFGIAVLIYVFAFFAESFGGTAHSTVENRLKGMFAKWWFFATLFFIAVFSLANGIVFALPYAGRLYLWILKILKVELTQSLIAATIVLIAYGAYRFKKAKQRWYGIVEVMFAAVTVIVALKTTLPSNRLGLATALVGAIYVGSRGFANIDEGL